MYIVDRCIAVIKPKKPFLEWLKSMPDNDMFEVSLDVLRSDCTVLMLPEFDEPEQAIAYIDDISEQLFKVELATWYEDEKLWPADMSLKTFWEWFDVEVHSTVIDTVDDDLSNSEVIIP